MRLAPLVAAASSLWLPACLPLLGLGPLTECDHCVRTYLAFLAVAPGAVPGFLCAWLFRVPSDWIHPIAMGTFTALELGGLTLLLARIRSGVAWAVLLCAVAAASAAQAFAFASMMRA